MWACVGSPYAVEHHLLFYFALFFVCSQLPQKYQDTDAFSLWKVTGLSSVTFHRCNIWHTVQETPPAVLPEHIHEDSRDTLFSFSLNVLSGVFLRNTLHMILTVHGGDKSAFFVSKYSSAQHEEKF